MNGLPVVDMIYGKKKFEAFFLKTWLTEGGMLKTILRWRNKNIQIHKMKLFCNDSFLIEGCEKGSSRACQLLVAVVGRKHSLRIAPSRRCGQRCAGRASTYPYLSRAILLQTSNKWYDFHLNVSIDRFQVPKPGQKAENTDGRLKIWNQRKRDGSQ